jgi:hypothetical protein
MVTNGLMLTVGGKVEWMSVLKSLEHSGKVRDVESTVG